MQQTPEFSTGTTFWALVLNPSDPQAWERFVKRYGGVIYGWCLRKGLQAADAENVTQDVLLDWFRALKTFTYDRGKGTFRAWLYTVTRHALADYGKKQKQLGGQRQGVDLADVEDREDLQQRLADEFDLELADVARARVQLLVSRRDWEIYTDLTHNGRSGREVAAERQMKVTAVVMVKHRVQQKLQEEIRRLEGALE
jgi:RNA polymerase sigma-70 factor (ECF subfamily)